MLTVTLYQVFPETYISVLLPALTSHVSACYQRVVEHKSTHSETVLALKQTWKDYVQTNGLNTTLQRELIVEEFLACNDHVSTDQLLERIRKQNKKIGYATVYRTLKLLVDAGIAHQRDFGDGQTRYEAVSDHHDHLICTLCGLVLEFEDEEIERLQEAVAKRLGGFHITRHRLELYGLCPKEQGIPGGLCPNDARC